MRTISQNFRVLTGLLFTSLLSSAAPSVVPESPIVIDLSGERTWEEISASGASFSGLQGFTRSKVYHLSASFVVWKFPGGAAFQHHMTHGEVVFRDDRFHIMRSYGELMPLDEVLILARRLQVLLQEPADRLEKWALEQGPKGMNGANFLFRKRGCNPEMAYEVKHSFGAVFPWKLVLHAEWPDEKKLKKPLPPPFAETGLVNLDPPSGKRYTPEEDFHLYQEKHGYKEPPPHSPWQVEKTNAKKTDEPRTSAVGSEPEASGGYLWLWISSALTATAVAYWLLNRRQGRRGASV